MLNKNSILDKFSTSSTTFESQLFPGEEIKIQKLSLVQRAEVDKELFKNTEINLSGETKIPMLDYNKGAIIGVSHGMVEPKMTVDEIKALGNDALPWVIEVFEQIKGIDKPKN